jgi:5-formaminoimidazole-4-carboxamide-1-(beta)-D-ribofuranosyl 5'-monophosphate synthetase
LQGSPYSDLIFDEPMSMGRRVAREIKIACEKGVLQQIIT